MQINILAFTAGVWWLQHQATLPTLIWSLALPALLISLRHTQKNSTLHQALSITASIGAGIMWATAHAQIRLSDALPSHWQGRDIQFVGTVAALPNTTEHSQRFPFNVEQILTPNAHIPRHIQLTSHTGKFSGSGRKTTASLPPVHAGERWQLTARLQQPHSNANPHGFDLEAWALERNLRAIGHVQATEDNRRITATVYRPSYLIEIARETVAQRFQRVLGDAPYAGVLKALAIGDQAAISPAQWQLFNRTGITHLMSISGSHITILSGLIYALTQALWRRSFTLTQRLPAHKAAALMGVLAATGYVWLSGSGVPAQRTLYMLTTVAIALWMGRAGSASRVLCMALFVVLLLDPWAVLAPGFWLSFGAVSVIFYISINRLCRPHWLRGWLKIQWAVTLGLIPALLLMFQQVSLISPLANAIGIPVIGMVVTPLTLLGALLPLDFVLFLAHEIMAGCMAALQALDRLPNAVWQQAAPPFWTVAAAAVGIFWMLLPRGFPARWLGLSGLLPLFLVHLPQPQEGALWLTVLDVGQGLAVVAQTQHHALLFDTGPRLGKVADTGSRVIVPFLRGMGISKLDGMIVSHNDNDHSGGAMSILQTLTVDWLASSLSADNPISAMAHRSLPCYAGQSWLWDGVRFDILHPAWTSQPSARVKDNDRSCVLKITTRHNSVLLPADAEVHAEQEMLARTPELLASTVLVAGHHGSKSSSSEEFIARVHPKMVVFTVGYRNRWDHPKPEIVERFQRLGATPYRSDTDGALLFRFGTNGSVQIQAWRETNPRYWSGVRNQ